MPSAPNTKSTAGESEDTCSDGNGENAPFPHGLTGRLQRSACTPLHSTALRGTPLHSTAEGRGTFVTFLPYLLDASPVYNVLRYPSDKGWGIFRDFLPYLLEALPLYGPLRHPVSKGWGVFRDFYPYLLDCTRPLLHSLSDFKISPSDHQAGLPYTTAPFSVRNGLASASRTERGRFSVPDGESPQGYRALRLRCSNLNTNMPLESNFRARL